jgi:hypothetical protein
MASKTSKAGRKTSNLGAKRKLDAFPGVVIWRQKSDIRFSPQFRKLT